MRDKFKNLHIFDIDGTLFRSPEPTPSIWGFEKLTSIRNVWFRCIETLSPPHVPFRPSFDWYNLDVVESLQKSLNDVETLTVVMTGRCESKGFRPAIERILVNTRIPNILERLRGFVFLKDRKVSTSDFKIEKIRNFIVDYQIEHVEIWEDRFPHVLKFEEFLEHGKEQFDFEYLVHHCYVPPIYFSSHVEKNLVSEFLSR